MSESDSIAEELRAAGDRDLAVSQSQKKNYAEKLSRGLAQRFANALRQDFPGVLPTMDGQGQESRARTAKGYKKLDINYSTMELGLGLGVSIKTINFRDPRTKRYTKNYTRVDNELRAEAADYHERQPYAVMVAIVFLPIDACDDGSSQWPSSFGQAIQIFRFRSGRDKPNDPAILFERVLVGLYDVSEREFGKARFFDVAEAPPRSGRPTRTLSFDEAVAVIVGSYDKRNKPQMIWNDAAPESVEPFPDEESDD